MTIYLITNFIFFLFFSVILKTSNWFNTFIKVFCIVMTIITAYFFVMNAFPDNTLFGQFQVTQLTVK